MPFKRYVEIGRVAMVNYGEEYGRLVVITDVLDQNRVRVRLLRVVCSCRALTCVCVCTLGLGSNPHACMHASRRHAPTSPAKQQQQQQPAASSSCIPSSKPSAVHARARPHNPCTPPHTHPPLTDPTTGPVRRPR